MSLKKNALVCQLIFLKFNICRADLSFFFPSMEAATPNCHLYSSAPCLSCRATTSLTGKGHSSWTWLSLSFPTHLLLSSRRPVFFSEHFLECDKDSPAIRQRWCTSLQHSSDCRWWSSSPSSVTERWQQYQSSTGVWWASESTHVRHVDRSLKCYKCSGLGVSCVFWVFHNTCYF